MKTTISKLLLVAMTLSTGMNMPVDAADTVATQENTTVMPAYNTETATATQTVIDNKQAVSDLIVYPYPDPNEPVLDPPPTPLPGPITPPLIDWSKITFPPIDYGYVNKEGYSVKIKSDKETLTVSWEKPTMGIANSGLKSYSLNYKTGVLTEISCVSVCKTRDLNPIANRDEYLAGLKAMSEKVAEGLRSKKPRTGTVYLKLQAIQKTLNYIIEVISARVVYYATTVSGSIS